MPDFLRKATRHTAKVCHADEQPTAALFVRPRIGDETKRLGAPASTVSRRQSSDPGSGEGPTTADALFEQNAVLVLTDQRLLVFGHGSLLGRVRELIGALDLSDVVEMDLEVPPAGSQQPATLRMAFADGSTVALTPGSRRKQFLAAYEASTQPA